MKIVDGFDGKDKDRLMDEQVVYMFDINCYCCWNFVEDGQGQMLDVQFCWINCIVNCVDVLQVLILKQFFCKGVQENGCCDLGKVGNG